jgi:hypothetical protein
MSSDVISLGTAHFSLNGIADAEINSHVFPINDSSHGFLAAPFLPDCPSCRPILAYEF